MNFFSRHRNTVVLAAVLLAQLLALAVQVKRQTAEGPVSVIRLVVVGAITPLEKAMVYTGDGVRDTWRNYVGLRGVRQENERLREEIAAMRLERAHEQEELRQAHRMQALLEFKQKWIDTTVAAQVIGTSGMASSHLLFLDKGSDAGIQRDMPVITPKGVVGKVLTVFGDSSQVLMINDASSGMGAIIADSRLVGIVKGTAAGELQLAYIMAGETVKPGEQLVTSGGDRVFPKGLPIGTVQSVHQGHDLFLDIKVKPAAELRRLDEVLVITQQRDRLPDQAEVGDVRAADILSGRLPSVPPPVEEKPAAAPAQPAAVHDGEAGRSGPQ